MKPDLKDVRNVAFRLFTKGQHDVPKVEKWDNAPVEPGKAWDRIGHHLKGNGKGGQPPNPKHTEMSIELVNGKTVYVIEFGNDTQTEFGPGGAPITLLPPSLSGKYLSDVGLVFLDASGAPDFLAAEGINADTPKRTALMFTCDRVELEKVWKDSFKGHDHAVPLAVPFFLNLYNATTKLPVWSSDAHGSIHPVGKNPPVGVRTHGGIHPSSNVQLLY